MSHVWFPPCCRPLVAMSITSTTLPWRSSRRFSQQWEDLPHRVAALPRWLREGEGGVGRGKAPSCSSAWSARTPTL